MKINGAYYILLFWVYKVFLHHGDVLRFYNRTEIRSCSTKLIRTFIPFNDNLLKVFHNATIA